MALAHGMDEITIGDRPMAFEMATLWVPTAIESCPLASQNGNFFGLLLRSTVHCLLLNLFAFTDEDCVGNGIVAFVALLDDGEQRV